MRQRGGKKYIDKITAQAQEIAVQRFCENGTINIIVSAHCTKARSAGIDFETQLAVGENDYEEVESLMCVILSNALENALNSCLALSAEKPRHISISTKQQSNRTFWRISNTCADNITFVDGIPQTDIKGHGFGTKSITAAVEKLNGSCIFKCENGEFVVLIVI